MILFDLTKQTVSGDGSGDIKEVKWSGDCIVNGTHRSPVKTVKLKATKKNDIYVQTSHIISKSEAGLFALLNLTPPFKISGQYQSNLTYAEVTL